MFGYLGMTVGQFVPEEHFFAPCPTATGRRGGETPLEIISAALFYGFPMHVTKNSINCP